MLPSRRSEINGRISRTLLARNRKSDQESSSTLGLTPYQAGRLAYLVRQFTRDVERDHRLRELVREIVREELYLEKQKNAYIECRPGLAEK
jgi:hypothetical protein